MRLLSLMLIFTYCMALSAQTGRETAQAILSNRDILCGESTGITVDKAKEGALADLSHRISAFVTTVERTGFSSTTGEYYDFKTLVTSNVRVTNVQYVTWEADNMYVAVAYITKDDFAKGLAERRERINQLIAEGMRQERELNIAGALKYYYWSLQMLDYYKIVTTVDVGGEERDAGAWLPTKITSVLQNIHISLVERAVTRADNADCVTLGVLYAGKRVSGLDITYFDGFTHATSHAKNGVATLYFTNMSSLCEIDLKIGYSYAAEAAKFDPELAVASAYGMRPSFDTYSAVTIPVSYQAGAPSIQVDVAGALENEARRVGTADTTDAAFAPLSGKERRTIDRPTTTVATDSVARYFAAMKGVEQAIRSGRYSTVSGLFTADGFELFMSMMRSGKVSVVGNDIAYSVDVTDLLIVGKRIPVAVKIGRHISNEDIVFRFDRSTGLISSVAYGLTKRAEDDIFRQASWSVGSRYSLLKFMEDYQTAFALKRIDYIRKIFSDSAIIITGVVRVSGGGNGYRDAAELNIDPLVNISYRHYTKDQYITKVIRDFAVKRYIQLIFEDCDISLVKTDGLVDNEVLWLEIKQHYISSNYSDVGYLALQLNMRPDNSQINVRTWTPVKVPMSQLKTSFPITIE